MEFNSVGNHLRNVWMDRLLFMVCQFLSSSNHEFPTQKVIHSSLYFSFFISHSNSTNTIYLCLLNSVVGLNFDFVVLNLTKHSSYLIYNASLYFSSAIQHQYFEKYGHGEVFLFLLSSSVYVIYSSFLVFPCSVLGEAQVIVWWVNLIFHQQAVTCVFRLFTHLFKSLNGFVTISREMKCFLFWVFLVDGLLKLEWDVLPVSNARQQILCSF